jgi:hypothetical protein
MSNTPTTTIAGIDVAFIRKAVADATLATLAAAKRDADKARSEAERAEAWLTFVTKEAEAGQLDDIRVGMHRDLDVWQKFLAACEATGDDYVKRRMFDEPGILIDLNILARVLPDYNPKPAMADALARFRS